MPRPALVTLLLLTLLAALLAWAYAPYGDSGNDEGFILGLSWRVANGQLPYRDFIYIRPPGSILLHALPMLALPARHVVLFERYLFFFIVAFYGYLAAATLDRTFGLAGLGLDRLLLSAAGLVLSVQGFPPMAWHTVDGLLLGSAAVYLLVCARSAAGVVAGGLLLFLSATCKQSFFFLVPFALIHTALTRSRRDLALLAGTLAGLSVASAAALSQLGLLEQALGQWTGQTRLDSLFNAGAISYVKQPAMILIPGVLAWVGLSRLRSFLGRDPLPRAAIPYVGFVGVLGVAAAAWLWHGRFQPPPFNFPAILFLSAAVPLAFERGREALTLGLLLGLAWCASLSWGYQTPVLFSLPGLFGALYFGRKYCGTNPRRLAGLVLLAALAIQFLAYQFPYGDARRSLLVHPAGDAFPRLRGVHTSISHQRRYAELAALRERYGDRFTVLPGLPLAHFLTDSEPLLPVDWSRNSETDGRTAELIRRLEGERLWVFLETDAPGLCRGGAACSDLAWHVREHWQAVEHGEYFVVYRAGD